MRPVRSLLYVPANDREWVEDTPYTTQADGVIFDLEDATPPAEKEHGRDVLEGSIDGFRDTETLISVRVNAPSSGRFEADLDAIVTDRLDAIVLPKVDSEEYVRYADNVLTYLERRRDISDRIEFILLPESAYGLYNPYELCVASDRVGSIMGATTNGGDFNRALGYEWTREGTESLFARSNVLAGARAAGLREIMSGLWSEIDDIEGLRGQASFARQLGYTGYQIIHPSHAEPVNEIFTPDATEIAELRAMMDELDGAIEAGTGVVEYDGEMIDAAHVRTAREKIDRARAFDVVE